MENSDPISDIRRWADQVKRGEEPSKINWTADAYPPITVDLTETLAAVDDAVIFHGKFVQPEPKVVYGTAHFDGGFGQT